jgi:signal transduction histidine kinase
VSQPQPSGPGPAWPSTRRTVGPALYLLLALALGGMVVLSLVVNGHVQRAIDRTVAASEFWAPKFGEVSVLAALASEVDAPGNEVFIDGRAAEGRERMRQAVDSFNAHLAVAARTLPESLPATDRALLRRDLTQITEAIEIVVIQGDSLFTEFGAGRRGTAAQHMAKMDAAYASTLRGLRTLRADLGAAQDSLIRTNRREAEASSRLLRLAGLMMFLLAIGGGWLGYRLAREAERQAREREGTMDLVASAQAELEEAHARLTAAHQELESFSYSVAHDLRAPLRSIYGFSDALAEDAGDRLDDQGRSHLGKIRAASVRMGQLIDDLLTISRVTRHSLKPVPVDLSAMALELIEEFRAGDPGRTVRIEVAPGLTARADATLARILLQNLLGNAWKFTRRTPDAQITFALDGTVTAHQCPTFMVRDNGAGFDMTYAKKLFGAFQRLHTTSEFEGTGIGLATVRRVVQRHGGAVWGEGAVGNGATFWFTLER